jgi:hypothetical protein
VPRNEDSDGDGSVGAGRNMLSGAPAGGDW